MRFLKKNVILKGLTFILITGLLFSVMGCKEDEPSTVSLTGITIAATRDIVIIDTHQGTLQLRVIIVPADAAQGLVTWSVTNGTGSATIDQNGLVTAVSNGTVTAKAVAQSDETISDELLITISNQVTDNTAPLVALIADANQNSDETMVGLEAESFVSGVQWVLASDMDAFLAAIETAQDTLALAPLSDAEINEAMTALTLATTTFEESKQPGIKIVEHIELGSATGFAILSKTGISAIGTTSIIGNIGVSPVSASYITGFGLIMDAGNAFSTSSMVTGEIYAADYQSNTPTILTGAVADMMTAYQDGLSRTADYTELHTGNLSGQTLTSGVYMWSNDVLINTDVTLSGDANDVFIFQIAGTMTMAANTEVILIGGVQAKNVYWVAADTVAIGVGAHVNGIIISMTNVSMNTGSTITGMIYAQTSVSLDAATVTRQVIGE